MRRTGTGKLACVFFAGLLIFNLGLTDCSVAQDYQSDGVSSNDRNRGGGSNLIGPAIGLGITIIQEINRQKKIKKSQPAPAKTVKPKVTKKPKKVVKKKKKASKKKAKRAARTTSRKVAKKRFGSPHIQLPASLPLVAKAKPRIYSIGDKPWSSDKEFVIILKTGMTQEAVSAFLDQFGLTLVAQSRIDLLDQVVMKVTYPAEMSAHQALLMATDDRVYRVQPDYFYYPATDGDAAPTEMFAELQYAFDKMGLTQLNADESGRGITLAVIDSGISAEHPAIGDRVAARFSAFPQADAEHLRPDHGTAVASIISAQAGMRGVARDVSLLSAQVFKVNEAGHMVADSFDIVRGIDWAVKNGAEILNLSFAGSKDRLLQDALRNAERDGVILVAAAGNEGADTPVAYPAAYETVIAVTATDEDDGLYHFANRGEHVELAAPGVDILVAAGADGYGLQTGTSMATAYISGSIALMLGREPDLDTQDIKDRLARSAFDLGPSGRDPEFGHGRLDAFKAVTNNMQSASVN